LEEGYSSNLYTEIELVVALYITFDGCVSLWYQA